MVNSLVFHDRTYIKIALPKRSRNYRTSAYNSPNSLWLGSNIRMNTAKKSSREYSISAPYNWLFSYFNFRDTDLIYQNVILTLGRVGVELSSIPNTQEQVLQLIQQCLEIPAVSLELIEKIIDQCACMVIAGCVSSLSLLLIYWGGWYLVLTVVIR